METSSCIFSSVEFETHLRNRLMQINDTYRYIDLSPAIERFTYMAISHSNDNYGNPINALYDQGGVPSDIRTDITEFMLNMIHTHVFGVLHIVNVVGDVMTNVVTWRSDHTFEVAMVSVDTYPTLDEYPDNVESFDIGYIPESTCSDEY